MATVTRKPNRDNSPHTLFAKAPRVMLESLLTSATDALSMLEANGYREGGDVHDFLARDIAAVAKAIGVTVTPEE